MSIRYAFRPVTSRLYTRLLKKKWQDDAVEKVQISKGTIWNTLKPISLPDEFCRVTGHRENADLHNTHRLFSPTFYQGPSFAYKIRDAIIFDGLVLTKMSYLHVSNSQKKPFYRSPEEKIEHGLWSSYPITEKYFGHWLMDVPSHEMLADDLGTSSLRLDSNRYLHEPPYRELLGLQARAVRCAHVRNLWILDDYEINHHRAMRIRQLGHILRDKVTSANVERIYLSRGESSIGRSLINEGEVVNALSEIGFEILTPENMQVHDIIGALSSANIVVASEGSILAHAAMICKRGTTLVTLHSPSQFNSIWKTFCDALGFRFAFVVGDSKSLGTFAIPIDRLIRTIDLVEASF